MAIQPPTETERQLLANWARRELAKQDLIEFCAHVDPGAEINYRAPHMRVIADFLEKVDRGEIKRLFITAPPRHWKSSLTCEKFLLWYLARHPDKSIGCFSHGAALPTRFSNNVRNNILYNSRFQQLFPDIQIREDSARVSDWSLVKAYRSSFRSMGVGSSPTGEGFNVIVIDDPIGDAFEANSPTQLEKVWLWYTETLRDRLEPDGAIILVMSRWSIGDLAGRVLKASASGEGEQWEQVHLKALAEPAEGRPDPLNRLAGEALWPDRWPVRILTDIRKTQGARAFAARFQGEPRSLDGNILNHALLKMVTEEQLPRRFVKIVRRWDLAFSERQGADFVAGMKMGLDDKGNRYLLHLKRIHGRWTHSKQEIIRQAQTDGILCTCAIEANGTQLGYYQDIRDDPRMHNRTVIADEPEGTKEMRASVWGSRLEDGIIYCVIAPWNQELFDEMDYFGPNCEHDDIIDSVSGGWKLLGEGGGGYTPVPSVSRERIMTHEHIRHGRGTLL